jgi:hypothetical protein
VLLCLVARNTVLIAAHLGFKPMYGAVDRGIHIIACFFTEIPVPLDIECDFGCVPGSLDLEYDMGTGGLSYEVFLDFFELLHRVITERLSGIKVSECEGCFEFGCHN